MIYHCGQAHKDIDAHQPGPFGDEDVRLIQYSQSREPIGATPVAEASRTHQPAAGLSIISGRYAQLHLKRHPRS